MAIVPHCVAGGFRMVREDWSRSSDGWDCDYDFEGLDDTIFATEADCQQAINEQYPIPGQMSQDDRDALNLRTQALWEQQS